MPSDPADLVRTVRAYLETRAAPLVADFCAAIGWPLAARPLPAAPLPCLAFLEEAEKRAGACEQKLAAALAAEASGLHWGQTYSESDLPRRFLDRYGWVELFGSRGHFVHDRLAGGFLVLGPDTLYPDHHHVAEELYIPLTGGTQWRQGGGPFAVHDSGSVIHHRSGVSHAMRTRAAPLVALYLWRDGPLAERSVLAVGGKSG